MPLGIQVSSVPAFQDALVAALSARTNLLSTNVVLGPPSAGVSQASEWIALLEVKSNEHWASIGRLQREEKYTQQIYISVMYRDGEVDSKNSRDRAYTLRNEIAQQLISDPTVSGTVWQCQLGEKHEFYPRLGITVPDALGGSKTDLSWREAALYIDIDVINRLQRV